MNSPEPTVNPHKCVSYSAFSDYRYKKDELFKRLKVTTFAQLVSLLIFYWTKGESVLLYVSLYCSA